MKKYDYILSLVTKNEKYESIHKFIGNSKLSKLEKLEDTKNLSDYMEILRSHIRLGHEKKGDRKGFRNRVSSDLVIRELYDLFRECLHDTRISSKNKAIVEMYIMNCFSYKEIGLLLKKNSSSIKKIVDETVAKFSDKILKYLDDEV